MFLLTWYGFYKQSSLLLLTTQFLTIECNDCCVYMYSCSIEYKDYIIIYIAISHASLILFQRSDCFHYLCTESDQHCNEPGL